MRIFVSHSSHQKLFVNEVKRRLPQVVDLWLDEHKLLVGDEIEVTLEEAINKKSDFVLLVIDEHAVRSDWVRKEVAWAVQHEKTLGRTFLLPIVLDVSAWQQLLDEPLRARKYLPCNDFSPFALDAFVNTLVLQLFTWMARERSQTAPAPSPLTELDAANLLASSLAAKVRMLVHPHRRDNPLTIANLAAGLRQDPTLWKMDTSETLDLLRRLRAGHMLGGIFYNSEVAYLAKERNFYKRTLFGPAKRAIAKAATHMIRSGDRIGIDGGSTTLEVAFCLSDELRAQSITDIEVFTNSVPVADHLLQTLSELEADDRDGLCRVILTGGWCRPTSLTVSPISGPSVAHETNHVCPSPPQLDLSFLGTNGLHGIDGFGLAHQYEIPAKRALLDAAKRKVFLVDPSKFEVQQDILFARFDEGLEILTAQVDSYSASIGQVRGMIEGSGSTLTVVGRDA